MIRKSFVTGTLVCSVLFCILGVGLWWILQAPPQRGPIERTDLEQSFVGKMIEGSNWRAVDFALTAEEERNLDRCLELTKRVNAFLNGVSRFAEDDVREELESVLEAQPDFFYAEYLLGLWHDMRGNATERTRLSALALSHAPIVLEQRYFDKNGAPLANVSIQEFAIECNRIENGSLDPSLQLRFFRLVTDGNGAIRLPVYDTVYRRASASFPDGYDVEYPKLGWFQSRTKTGVLPDAVVRKRVP